MSHPNPRNVVPFTGCCGAVIFAIVAGVSTPRPPSGEPWDRALLRAAGDDSHLLRSERFAAPTNAEEGTESCSYRAAQKYASPHIHRANRPKGALRALPAPRS